MIDLDNAEDFAARQVTFLAIATAMLGESGIDLGDVGADPFLHPAAACNLAVRAIDGVEGHGSAPESAARYLAAFARFRAAEVADKTDLGEWVKEYANRAGRLGEAMEALRVELIGIPTLMKRWGGALRKVREIKALGGQRTGAVSRQEADKSWLRVAQTMKQPVVAAAFAIKSHVPPRTAARWVKRWRAEGRLP